MELKGMGSRTLRVKEHEVKQRPIDYPDSRTMIVIGVFVALVFL